MDDAHSVSSGSTVGTRAPSLTALRQRVEAAEGPDREIDREIAIVCGWQQRWDDLTPIPYTASLERSIELVHRMLPGFWLTCGLCSLSGHASLGPDYNGPHGERLRKEWPEAQYHSGFDADLSPGDGIHRTCLALLAALLHALSSKEESDAK
jgi:hypothetical protein